MALLTLRIACPLTALAVCAALSSCGNAESAAPSASPTAPDARAASALSSTPTPEQVTSSQTLKTSSSEAVLTVKNNKDLAAMVSAVQVSRKAKEFADKYQGQTIEFDGIIAAMGTHGDYSTRYDILLFAGNKTAEGVRGPNFQFRDVNIVSDLKLSGAGIPDTIGVGQRLRVTAKVTEYEMKSDLFLLEPVSTRVR